MLIYLLTRGVRAFVGALIITTLTVYYVTDVGMGPFELVLAGAVFEAAILLCELPTGVVADTYSRRLSVILGVAIFGAGLLLMGLVPVLAAVLVANVVAGVGDTFMSGATEAWLAGELGEDAAGPAYVRGAQLDHAAGIAGMAGSVALASYGLHLPLVAGGALYLALAAVLGRWMPERGFTPAPRSKGAARAALPLGDLTATLRQSARRVQGSRVLLALLAASLLAGAGGEGFDRLWEVLVLRELTLPRLGTLQPVVWFGIINIAAALAGLLAVTLLRARLDAWSADARAAGLALAVLTALLAASTAAYALAGGFAAALAFLVVRAALGALAAPLAQAWLVRHTDTHLRATMLSIASQANALGETFGGLGVGLAAERVSLRAALVVSGALLLPAAGLYAGTAGFVRRALLRRAAD
jgi:MFS transporter, DHA3 family, tetracycline resistance protein